MRIDSEWFSLLWPIRRNTLMFRAVRSVWRLAEFRKTSTKHLQWISFCRFIMMILWFSEEYEGESVRSSLSQGLSVSKSSCNQKSSGQEELSLFSTLKLFFPCNLFFFLFLPLCKSICKIAVMFKMCVFHLQAFQPADEARHQAFFRRLQAGDVWRGAGVRHLAHLHRTDLRSDTRLRSWN